MKKPKKTTKTAAKKKPAAVKNDAPPKRREIGAVVCLLLGIFSFLGFFTGDGWFISFFTGLMRGLIGAGYYLLPFALLGCAVILGFHRGRPVRLRVACALLSPVMLGAIWHLLGCATVYEWRWSMFTSLYTDGMAKGSAMSGGAISGFAAILFESLFSKVGAAIVFICLLAVVVMAILNISVSGIADAIRNRPRKEYELEEPAERGQKAAAVPDIGEGVQETRRKRKVFDAENAQSAVVMPMNGEAAKGRSRIDLPVDEPTRLPPERKSFFDPNPNVKTPDQVLKGISFNPAEPLRAQEARPGAENKPEASPKSEASLKPQTSQTPQTPPQDKLPVTIDQLPPLEKKPEKLTREDTEQASQEVAADIESSLSEQIPPAYIYPPLELLTVQSAVGTVDGAEETRLNAQRLGATIKSFGISAEICNVTRGPSVTRYEVELDQGVKLNKLTNLADDIALSLGATGVRIAPIPDKISIVGIEVPNKLTNIVTLREIIGSDRFKNAKSELTFAIGKDIGNTPIVGDIAKLPHMLIAGTTGSGKSVCMNSLILSLLYKSSPDQVRLIMIDPKMIELGVYNGIPHLLIPVVTDPKKAAGALQWAVMEMLKRYKQFSEIGARDLPTYNSMIERVEGGKKLPRVVVLIDELADLMLVAAKDVEESICRVAQMGRASGIHLVIATQRPSADVITGLMKANIPSRIAFAVDSALNSRIILDQTGAEKLVGKGDMLYFPLGSGKPLRVQGTFVTDSEREEVIDFVKSSGSAEYSEDIINEIERNAEGKNKEIKTASSVDAQDQETAADDADELLPDAVDVVLESGQASVSMLQRRLKLGYSRAARIVDQMEERGIVGPFEGSKPRPVLITRDEWEARKNGTSYQPDPGEPVPDEIE